MTDEQVTADVEALIETVGKTDVTVGDRAGFIANALLFPYLNNAVRMLEGRYATREDIDAAMRFGCGHPMGPLARARPHRARQRLRDPRHDLPPVARPPARPGAAAQAAGHRRDARPQDRARLLHLRRPGLLADRARRRRRSPARRPARGRSARSASSAPARWPPASPRCSPRRATTSCCGPAATTRPPPTRVQGDGVAGQGGRARQARPRPTATPRSAASPTTTELDDLAQCDLVIEAVVEELGVKRALFGALDDVMKPGAVLATHDVEPAGHRVRHRHLAPGGRRRHALVQPGAGDEAGRGGADRRVVAPTRWPPCARSR